MRQLTIASAVFCLSAFGFASMKPAVAQGNITVPTGWSRTVSGGDILLSEPESESRLVVKKLVSIGNDENAWFIDLVKSDAGARGALAFMGRATRKGIIRSVTCKFQANGRTQSVAYIGYTTRAQGRLIIFSAASDQELAAAIRALQPYLKELGDYDNDPAQSRPAIGAASRPKTTNSPVTKTPLQPMNTASRGTLKSTQIVGLFLDESYGAGVGGMVIIRYKPVLLLRDGSARRNLEIPPLDIALAQDKIAAKKDWGRWTMRGGKYVVRWSSGSDDELKPDFKVRPGRPGEVLPGGYSTIGGGGNTALGGDVMIAYSNSYTFGRDGRFISGSSAGGGNSSVTTLSQSKNAGRYRIDGYALTFQFNDGRQVRRLFYFYPDGKRGDVIGIGDSAYTHDD